MAQSVERWLTLIVGAGLLGLIVLNPSMIVDLLNGVSGVVQGAFRIASGTQNAPRTGVAA